MKVDYCTHSNEIDMTDNKYSMTDDGLMIKSTSLKDVGTYECMVKKEDVELKSRPARIILEPDVSGCEYIHVYLIYYKTLSINNYC